MVNKKKPVIRRKGPVEDNQIKHSAQRRQESVPEVSDQKSRVHDEHNEEKVQGSRSRSGKMLRREPNGPVEFVISLECVKTFEKAGWLGYLQCLRGYHTEVALAFASSFDGHEATIGVINLFVSEVSIAELGRLPLGGKRFTKKDRIDEQAANKFLRSEFHNPDWSKGIEADWLKSEYAGWLKAIKLYITCDGRYNHMFRYQIWFLMHLAGDIQINFPYFLLQSLTKMSKKIQKFPGLAESSLLHQSLITMLVNDALDCHNMTFSEFLTESDFSWQSSCKKKKTEKGESSKGASKERVKEEISGGSKLKKPENKVTYERRSVRIQKGKNEPAEGKQVQSEKSIEKPSVRTRPTNKFRLKGKMLMNPNMKSDEVILINSDQSSSEDHADELKKKRKVISDDETSEKLQKIPVSKRKTKKKVKAKSSSGNRKLKKKLLVEELTYIVENAVNTDVQAKIKEMKKRKKAK